MCRLFGYRGAHHESLKRHFLDAERSFYTLSDEHRDGWGIAYFHDGAQHVIKSTVRAAEDVAFKKLAERLCATTVVAHLRRATQGEINLLNCHPFQHGKWVFAHNGDLPEFSSKRAHFSADIAPDILEHVYGNTDSEMYFALFHDELRKGSDAEPSLTRAARALRRTIARIMTVYEGYELKKPFALNVLATDGDNFLAFRHGHGLYFRVDEQQLFVCSEPLSKDDGYQEMQEGQMIGVDKALQIFVDL